MFLRNAYFFFNRLTSKAYAFVTASIKIMLYLILLLPNSLRLPLPSKVTVMTATRAADKMSSSAVNPTCPASYLFTTSCSDGRVRFWSCKDIQDGKQFEWEEMSWISGKKNLLELSQTSGVC